MKIEITPENAKQRLDVFLEKMLIEHSRSAVKKLIEEGNILLNNEKVKSGEKLRVGDVVYVTIPEPKQISTKAENIDIDIIYQDSDVAVINKAQGMVVHPANGNFDGTLVNALLYHIKDLSGINGELRPGIVHRLDKDTSGLMVVAKNDNAHRFIAKQLEDKTCHRNYLALVEGNIKTDGGTIETRLDRSKVDRKKMAVTDEGGRIAITDYKVVERFGKYTLVDFSLKTGRTHQIRVHSKYICHPVVGDLTYGRESKEFKLNGQLLHAYRLEFVHPSTKKLVTFECSLPDYFEKVLSKLRKNQ